MNDPLTDFVLLPYQALGFTAVTMLCIYLIYLIVMRFPPTRLLVRKITNTKPAKRLERKLLKFGEHLQRIFNDEI